MLCRAEFLTASHEPRPCLSPSWEGHCSINSISTWFGVLLVYWLIMSFCLLLQMHGDFKTRLGYFKQHSSSRLWKEYLKTFKYRTVWAGDGREWYCLHGMPFHLGFWTSCMQVSFSTACFFQAIYKNVKALQRIHWDIAMANSCT